jgi:hypothetical protein
MKPEFDMFKWSTVVFIPTFWWRVKALFKAPEITFCWGQDQYAVRGLKDAEYFAIGGVPDKIRKEFEK